MDLDFWDTLSFLYKSWLFMAQFSFVFYPSLRWNDPDQIFSLFLFPLLVSVLGLSLSFVLSHQPSFFNHPKDSDCWLLSFSPLSFPPPTLLTELKKRSELQFPPPQSSSPPEVCRSRLRNPADPEPWRTALWPPGKKWQTSWPGRRRS